MQDEWDNLCKTFSWGAVRGMYYHPLEPDEDQLATRISLRAFASLWRVGKGIPREQATLCPGTAARPSPSSGWQTRQEVPTAPGVAHQRCCQATRQEEGDGTSAL
mmetsp:Transcript_61028/g.125836  ORF Transcript_61028/g.125836 Transcript_61028/m.125836 type:complete len:105 (-) Transcript_61028:930-1244(-)